MYVCMYTSQKQYFEEIFSSHNRAYIHPYCAAIYSTYMLYSISVPGSIIDAIYNTGFNPSSIILDSIQVVGYITGGTWIQNRWDVHAASTQICLDT